MKKFLFTTLVSNDLGLLTRSLPIAHELRDRGHQIAFCNPAKAPRRLISDAGFDNLPLKWNVCNIASGDIGLSTFYRLMRSKHLMRDFGVLLSTLRYVRRHSTAEVWNLDHFMCLLGMWNENFVRADVDALIKLIDDYNPNAVVDFWNIGACIAARASHKRLITVIQADVHPESRGFVWWKEPILDIPTPVTAINQILAERHLRPIVKTGALFIGDTTLLLGIPETDPLPDTAIGTYVGPVLWQRSTEKLPGWVGDLDTKRPVIWLYPGNPQYFPGTRSYVDSAVVTRACIEALGNKDFQVVMSTGHHLLPKDAVPLPSNFRHGSFVPGLTMAKRSDLLIHHGGYGSCQTGLFTGTPALIIPTYSERESNARRIAAVGAGDFVLPTMDVSGRKKQVSAAEVSDKVNRVLKDPSFKENAKRISDKFHGYGGASYAASLIEDSI